MLHYLKVAKMKFAKSLLPIGGAVLLLASLSACSSGTGSSADSALGGDWTLTARGDVYCLTIPTSMGHNVTDCNWETLTSAGTHTTNEDDVYASEWLFVEGGEVFCLVSYTRAGYSVPDCDWSSIKN